MTKAELVAENLLDWADEIEELNIKNRFLGKVNRNRLSQLTLDLHIAAGVIKASHKRVVKLNKALSEARDMAGERHYQK